MTYIDQKFQVLLLDYFGYKYTVRIIYLNNIMIVLSLYYIT